MSDTPETPNTDGASQPNGAGPIMRVMAQYLKDLSFESPKAPESFGAPEAPNIDVSVDVNARSLGQDQFEVELSVTARAARENEPVFVVETTYAGAFLIQNVPAEQMEPVMLVECPRLLFPFLRQIIADATRNGNFPPLLLEPIDFMGIYQQRLAQTQAQQASQDAGAPPADA